MSFKHDGWSQINLLPAILLHLFHIKKLNIILLLIFLIPISTKGKFGKNNQTYLKSFLIYYNIPKVKFVY